MAGATERFAVTPLLKVRRGLVRGAGNVFVWWWVLFSFSVLMWIVVAAFKRNDTVFQELFAPPKSLNLQNFGDAWDLLNLTRTSLNTLLTVGVGTFVTMALAARPPTRSAASTSGGPAPSLPSSRSASAFRCIRSSSRCSSASRTPGCPTALGKEAQVHLDVDATFTADDGSAFVATVDPADAPSVEARVGVAFDSAAVHVFDPESGAAVGPGIQSAVPDAG